MLYHITNLTEIAGIQILQYYIADDSILSLFYVGFKAKKPRRPAKEL